MIKTFTSICCVNSINCILFIIIFSFDSLAALATKLTQNKEVREKAQQLDEERRALQRGWQQKDDFLRQTFDLQIFNKEADQIDAASSSHEAFLEFADLGVSFSHLIFSSSLISIDALSLNFLVPYFSSLLSTTWKPYRSDTTILKTH